MDRSSAFMLGSVSRSLMSVGTCPIVVVRSAAVLDHDGVLPVAVGVDGTRAAAAAAVEFGFRQASYDAVPVIVAHATWDRLPFSAAMDMAITHAERNAFVEQDEIALAETIAGLPEKYPDVEVQRLHRSGDPAQVLVDLSLTASLVVVGSRGHGAPGTTLVGSVGRRVAVHARCPVAVVSP